MFGKQSIIEDFCAVVSLTATPGQVSCGVIGRVQYSERSMSNRVKLPLDADVGTVLSLSPLILKLEMQLSTMENYCRRSAKSRSTQKNQ